IEFFSKMSINQAHYQGGIVLFQGEAIVYHAKDVRLKFKDGPPIMGTKEHKGKLFVTTHRLIFLSGDANDALSSFASAFMYMKDLKLNQPIFGSNNIVGSVNAHPN
ncbi:unnamed protein product, partial [Didymodactylos carnosus]